MNIVFNLAFIISSALHVHVTNGFTLLISNVGRKSLHSTSNFPNIVQVKVHPCSLQMSSPEKSEVEALDVMELDDDKIAEMIEVTFIKACLQLATGYVDVLKLFLAATNAAYDRKIPLPKLVDSVDNCPLNTANRELSPQEIEVRSSWMAVSYLTLETIDRLENAKGEDYLSSLDELQMPDDIRSTYLGVVEEMVRKDFGIGQGDDDATSSADLLSGSDPQTAALIAYNKKIISLTVSNVKEARLAYEKVIDENDVGPPRPNIPGTY